MKIEKLGGDFFKVNSLRLTKTEHKVTIKEKHHQQLTDDRVTAEDLLEFSFKFLLERAEYVNSIVFLYRCDREILQRI